MIGEIEWHITPPSIIHGYNWDDIAQHNEWKIVLIHWKVRSNVMMKTMDTAAIEETVQNALKVWKPQQLPTRVDSWIVEVGLDSTDDPAVWVWGILAEDKVDTATRAQLRERVRAFVQDAIKNEVKDPISWVYVRFRTPSELNELKEIEEEEKREALEKWGES